MSRVRVTGKQLVAALLRAGFRISRTRGSHRFLRHPDGRGTTVSVHSGEIIGPGLLSKIPHDAEVSREELLELLRC